MASYLWSVSEQAVNGPLVYSLYYIYLKVQMSVISIANTGFEPHWIPTAYLCVASPKEGKSGLVTPPSGENTIYTLYKNITFSFSLKVEGMEIM